MTEEYSYKKIMIFGSFDGLHPGHEYLIENASTMASQLCIVVAQDAYIENTKEKKVRYVLDQRIAQLKEKYPHHTIIEGDNESEDWSVIHEHQPDGIVVGYDQHGLKKALEKIQEQFQFSIIQLDAFHPEKYKSSILRANQKG